MNDSEILLRKCLNICRARSGVDLENWHVLKKGIHSHLLGLDIDISDDLLPKKNRKASTKKEIKDLWAENKKLENENQKLKRFMSGVISLQRQYDKKH